MASVEIGNWALENQLPQCTTFQICVAKLSVRVGRPELGSPMAP
jgi:hypothetical protein